MIKPFRNDIIFQFLNDRESSLGQFKETTSFGFEIIANADDSAKKPRWALVSFVGPDVLHIIAGSYILIEPLKWTDVVKHNNISYWKTDEKQVLIVSKDKPSISY